MPATCILEPQGSETNDEDRKRHKSNWEKIKKVLGDMKTDKKMEFSDFLKDLSLSPEDYILAVRSSLSSTRLYIKRLVHEISVTTTTSFCCVAGEPTWTYRLCWIYTHVLCTLLHTFESLKEV